MKFTAVGLLILCLLLLILEMAAGSCDLAEWGEPCFAEALVQLTEIERCIEEAEWTEAGRLVERLSHLIWNAAQLEIRTAAAVVRPPLFCGHVVENPEPTYRCGEDLHLYVEPVYYEIGCRGAFFFSHLRLGLTLLHEQDRKVWTQPQWRELIVTAIRPFTTAYFHGTLELGPGFPLGRYEAVLAVTDLLADETLEHRIPFMLSY